MFNQEVEAEVSSYTTRLGGWPAQFVTGEQLIPAMQATLQKVEGNVLYREQNRNVWATMYRMIGGAYLIHSSMGMNDKLRNALTYLSKSRELWPEQQKLDDNIGVLQAFLNAGQEDIREYFTTVLQILRGPGDAQIPAIVEQLVAVGQQQKRSA